MKKTLTLLLLVISVQAIAQTYPITSITISLPSNPDALLANNALLSEADAMKAINFRWTPVVPKPHEPVTYRIKVWQLMQGQNGAQAMKANQPIFTKDVDNITQVVINKLVTGPCLPPYLCSFIWNVQALSKEGKPIGINNGTSANASFSVKQDLTKEPAKNR
ncbi:hypothetical protein [Daejeonella sp.]|uniref:hypothetical protein n=1 Tax=Daejeonella sp. TaxID=2805397 RepID=UPI0027308B39|nr:hypothetical protein [Daejeonella sp.]MDP2413574.1 hypothetical protein [Daejeonella sp.]